MDKKTKSVVFIILSSFSFAVMGAFVKGAGQLPSIEKSLFRNLISCIVAFILIIRHKSSFFGKKENQKYLLGRSLLGTLGIVASFYAIDHMVLSDASMLNKLSPFFVTIFAVIFLKEKINSIQVFALIGAFIGSLFIIKPAFNIDIIPALIGVSSAIFAGAAYTLVRFLGNKEEYYTIVFYFSLVSIITTLPFVIIKFEPFTFNQFLYLIGTGVFASIAQFSLTIAYKYAPASEVSIYDYVNIIFSAIIGQVIFNELPDKYSIFGYTLIIGASVAVFLYTRRKRGKIQIALEDTTSK
ncbi:DMT family transporter [Clostridium sp. MSJ-4]|uniref:DMT family transporter n=1 Tax=Clostridium simiarum TaxID=2841506 RepID=A0ABS6EYX8_9CLOT|nr:DMT family transporter [Clostridium simiarum]MBU5590572.1 DMT family transporter [Clostridium simiarum]